MENSTNTTVIEAAFAALDTPEGPSRALQRDAVRALVARLAEIAPGKTVEVRIPPFAAVQIIAGPRHTRGTPPNVVECDPLTFLELAAGRLDFAEAVATGAVHASGTRADLTDLLPLTP
ncbi:sterol carrier family protein [Stackebrandtia soli]|uniref:sterol carrier family protein n=1 Tax=Stackebrandtia soli TaxID=1892856 RepID=UPI0039E7F247